MRICLFCFVFCRNVANTLFSFSVYTTVVNNGLHEPCILWKNSSSTLLLSESHRGCLIWVKFDKIRKQKFESQLTVINPCSVLWESTLFKPIRAPVIGKLYYNMLYKIVHEILLSVISQAELNLTGFFSFIQRISNNVWTSYFSVRQTPFLFEAYVRN